MIERTVLDLEAEIDEHIRICETSTKKDEINRQVKLINRKRTMIKAAAIGIPLHKATLKVTLDKSETYRFKKN